MEGRRFTVSREKCCAFQQPLYQHRNNFRSGVYSFQEARTPRRCLSTGLLENLVLQQLQPGAFALPMAGCAVACEVENFHHSTAARECCTPGEADRKRAGAHTQAETLKGGQRGDSSDHMSRDGSRLAHPFGGAPRQKVGTPCPAASADMERGARRIAKEIQPSQRTHSPLPSCNLERSARKIRWLGTRGVQNGSASLCLAMVQCCVVLVMATAQQTPGRIEIVQALFNNPARQAFATQPKVCVLAGCYFSQVVPARRRVLGHHRGNLRVCAHVCR